jgi:hypothetical protein
MSEIEWPTTPCTDCGQPTTDLDRFPQGRCLKCHAAIWDKVPVSQLPRPDFVAALNVPRRKRTAR